MVSSAARLIGIALLAGSVVFASLLSGQERRGEVVDAAAIDRIRQLAARGSELADIARNLTDIYGPRLTGSPQLKAAADYAVGRLTAWGLSNAGLERWGPFGPGWTNDRFVALALAPQAYPLAAFPKAWTPGTPGEVIADAVHAPIEREGDFDVYRGRLRGRIVLTAPLGPRTISTGSSRQQYSREDLLAIARQSPAPATGGGPGDADRRAFERKRLKFYVDEGAAALIEPSRGDNGVLFVGDGRLRDDTAFAGGGLYPWPDEVPLQIVVASEQYDRLVRTLTARVTVTLELNVASTYLTAQPDSFNVIAEIPGNDPSNQVVMLGAHLDSWHAGTGATDNAAGCAVVLEAMRILKASGLSMRRTVRLALWTGSEQGQLGSRAYVRQHFADAGTGAVKPEHGRLSAYFNLDGGTGAIRGIFLEGNRAAVPVLGNWMTSFGHAGVTLAAPGPAGPGDHVSFDEAGLPGFQFLQDPVEYETRTRHSNLDVFDRLQIPVLHENAFIVASFIYHAANRAELLPRKTRQNK